MIVIKYVEISGTVGGAKIDLKVGIPIEAILRDLPAIADLFLALLPELKRKAQDVELKLAA